MRQIYLTFLFFLLTAILWAKPGTVTVSGFVFDESTGLPAEGQLITIKARNINPPFIYFEKLNTDSFGYFTKTIEFPYFKGILEVSTIDCNSQVITHPLTFSYNQTNLTTSFVICYNPQIPFCHSSFIYLPDQKHQGMIHFNETSLGDIQNYYWSFGDGDFSESPNPVHTYINDGNYEVCLTVIGNNGSCTDQYCEHIAVRSETLCTAMFTYSENYGMTNTVQFWDLSMGDISGWYWDFGDGASSNNQFPSHTFAGQGTYEVCLTVSDISGTCSNTYCAEVITGSNNDCKAMFVCLNDTLNPLTRQFMDISYGEPSSWQWSFGDNTYSSEQNPEHTFAENGMYNVCLAIYNKGTGCSDTYCQTIIIYQQLPCEAYFDYTQLSTEPYAYQFFDRSAGNIQHWLWDFGDGKTVNINNPSHIYYQSGEYEVCLTIKDDQGNCSDVYCETIYAGTIPGCTANFIDQQSESDPFAFNFFDNSQGSINNWNWDFGDGNTSQEQNPVHTFTEPGFYLICLSVIDNSGQCEDQICAGIFVTGQFPCQAGFDFLIIPEDPLSVQFTDASTGNIGFWFWDFGDGTLSFEQNPLHTYSSNGIYNACLKVLDFNFQYSDQFCKTVEINYDPTCTASFAFTPTPTDPFTYHFIDNSTGTLAKWFWTFGDGNSSDLQNPTHTFDSEGVFEVCLTVTNFWGNCEDIFCTNIVIDIPQLCTADFDFVTIPDTPLNVQFTDFSSGIMTQLLWDFGDGNTSNLQNPLHVFADTGIYQVSLTIQNPDSLIYCYHTIIKQVPVYVAVPDCHANFVALPDSGINKPNLFHFYDRSSGSPDAWLWDFGDGITSTLQNPVHKFDVFGNYEVSLKIKTLNPWGDDCIDYKTLQFSSPQYLDFGGLVYAGNYPINNPAPTGDTARVFVYRYQNNSIQPIDTSQFTDFGYFYFLQTIPGDFLVKVKLTPGSTNASKYFPAYFGNHLRWQNALLLQLADSCNYHANINLVAMTETGIGTGKISGAVVHHNEKYYTPGPAFDTEILLFDANGNPLKYYFSDENGYFEFSNLNFGTYFLQAESTGLFSEPVMIILSDASPFALGIQLDLFDTDITTINPALIERIKISISPNPVGDKFYLNISSVIKQNMKMTIYRITGTRIVDKTMTVQVGDNKFPINSGDLPKGIYFLNLISNDGFITKTLKFIK